MKNPLTIVLIVSAFALACNRPGPVGTEEYLEQVETEFRKTEQLAERRKEELFGVFAQDLLPEEEQALKFLYAGMPLSDLADYSGDYFLKMVRAALRARKEFPWGRKMEPEIFRHYVLPYRVNDENLDTFRLMFYDELKERVEGMDLEEAVLEINHWCHEKVTYQGADIRTSSPYYTLLSARGRCGEESVFTVMALRTAGIPARQMYTPRWAHGDDNHAWVEVFIHGEWKYLGACEPEPVLDKGWFTDPAKRAMMVHTKVFGLYTGDERTVHKTRKYAVINHLEKYAPTRELHVQVLDDQNNPQAGAKVDYSIYNYAEFYPVASQFTNAEGLCHLVTGYGDLVLWAYKDGDYAWKKIGTEVEDTIRLRLAVDGNGKQEYYFTVNAPEKGERTSWDIEESVRISHQKRGAYEDSLRLAYVSSWKAGRDFYREVMSPGIAEEKIRILMEKSMGNYREIMRLVRQTPPEKAGLLIPLLENVSEKDLRDTPAEVFLDHLQYAGAFPVPEGLSRQDWNRYVLSPRVDNELLTPWRNYLQHIFPEQQVQELRSDPRYLVQWIQQVRIEDSLNYYRVPLSPEGVISMAMADAHSRDILLVAFSRSLGIPARLAEGTRRPEVFFSGEWIQIFLPPEAGLLPLSRMEWDIQSGNKKASYSKDYSLAQFRLGKFRTLAYPLGTEAAKFSRAQETDAGRYLLVSGKRVKDNKVHCRLYFFTCRRDQKTMVPFSIPLHEGE